MLKWTLWMLGVIILTLVIYIGSALVSLERLTAAARASNGSEVIARTDIARVRHAIVSQLIAAYLAKVRQTRPIKPLERIAIETFGASIVDDLAIKLITPDNVSAILSTGALRDEAAKLEITGMPALAKLDVSNVPNVLRRLHLI